ncbi:MAG: putative lipid II flippase FtsW [Deltaproteobacteria bacterium]|nr:putative lipid II flippase FtsW [Deltaproteobacteria bacterium]
MTGPVSRRGTAGGALSLPYDVSLLFPVLFLVGIGVVMVYSASSAIALKRYGTDFYFLKKQAVFSVMGLMTLVVFRRVPFQLFRLAAYPLLALSMVCLAAVLIPGLGVKAGGAVRWLQVGGIRFQPAEVARFALIVYLAYSLSKKQDQIREFTVGFLPHLLVMGVMALMILQQPDFGAVVLMGALAWIMLFVGGVRMTHLLSPLLLLLPLVFGFMIHAEYRVKRLVSFLDPWRYQSDEGYQVIHSLMAFGSGGIWGAGIGKGYQKLFYLPEPHTDFIFSVIGEELGMLGVLFILFLYALVLWRGIVIARNATDPFGQLIAIGITSAIALQVGVNMGVALGLLPTKGLTLPFLSYGGTSLLINMASVGILMNIGSERGK